VNGEEGLWKGNGGRRSVVVVCAWARHDLPAALRASSGAQGVMDVLC
jgi:hypothetical protein